MPKNTSSNGKQPKKMGRPRKEIDLEELEKLCALQCSDKEIAAWFNVSPALITERKQEADFLNSYNNGKEKGKISLRRMQFKLAEKNAGMAIWLGKQWLGQTEQPTHQVNVNVNVEDAFERLMGEFDSIAERQTKG